MVVIAPSFLELLFKSCRFSSSRLSFHPSLHSTDMVNETSTVRTFGSVNKAFNLKVPAQLQTAIKNQMELVPRKLTPIKNIAYDFLLRYNAINGDAAVATAQAAQLPNATVLTVRAAMNPLHGFMTAQGGVYATSKLFESLLRMAHCALLNMFTIFI